MRRLLLVLLVLAGLASRAEAAIVKTVNKVCGAGSGASSIGLTLPSLPSAGDAVIVWERMFDDRTITSVVDGNGGDAASVTGGTNRASAAPFTRVQTAGFIVTTPSTAITVNYSGSVTFTRVCAAAFSGVASPIAWDTALFAQTTAATSHASPALTPGVANSLVIAAIMVTAAGTPGADAAFTDDDADGDGRTAYKILSSITATTFTSATGGAVNGHIGIFSLQGTGGGGGGGSVHRLSTLGAGQ